MSRSVYKFIWILVSTWLRGCQFMRSALRPINTCNNLGLISVGNLQLSPIGASTWAWGNQLLWGYNAAIDRELRNTYSFLSQHGVNWFDTADSYGTGSFIVRSERLLGQFGATERSTRPYYCTKLTPSRWLHGATSVNNRILAAKQRLQSKTIDLVQLNWLPHSAWQELSLLNAFSRHDNMPQLGLANYGPQQLQRVAAQGIPIYTNQVSFSLLHRFPLQSGLTEACKTCNVVPIAYSPFAMGLLTDQYRLDRLPPGPRKVLFREYLPVITPLLDVLRDVARSREKTVPQVVLNWVLYKGFLPVVAMRSTAQAEENLGATGWMLTPSEVDCIDMATLKVGKPLLPHSHLND